MEIELCYFDGCPNWQATEAMLLRILGELGIDVEVHHTLIETPEAAERLGFRGSPTVLINGRDPFADPKAPIGLSCRIYRTETGLAGSPSPAQLRSALEASR
jgi:hypothetical protein